MTTRRTPLAALRGDPSVPQAGPRGDQDSTPRASRRDVLGEVSRGGTARSSGPFGEVPEAASATFADGLRGGLRGRFVTTRRTSSRRSVESVGPPPRPACQGVLRARSTPPRWGRSRASVRRCGEPSERSQDRTPKVRREGSTERSRGVVEELAEQCAGLLRGGRRRGRRGRRRACRAHHGGPRPRLREPGPGCVRGVVSGVSMRASQQPLRGRREVPERHSRGSSEVASDSRHGAVSGVSRGLDLDPLEGVMQQLRCTVTVVYAAREAPRLRNERQPDERRRARSRSAL